jgi:hypothetical protein
MKQLNEKEIETLATLLRRAQEHAQISISVASPYADGEDWKADGWSFNDRHDGNSISIVGCHVETSCGSGDEPVEKNGKTEWVEYKDRHEVSIYIPDNHLTHLTGILPEEADAVVAARKARASRAGKSRSAKKTKAAQTNWKKAVKSLKGKDA